MAHDPRQKRRVPSELWGDLMQIIRSKGPLQQGKNDLGNHQIHNGTTLISAKIKVTVKGDRISDIYVIPLVDNPHSAHDHLFVDSRTGDWMMMQALTNMDLR